MMEQKSARKKRVPALNRNGNPYPGVFYREVQRAGNNGTERSYLVVFKRDGKTIEEGVGRQFKDNMTPARANKIRLDLIGS